MDSPNSTTPRSPRTLLAGHVVAACTLDKCRGVIAGTNGEYHYDCPLDQLFFDFTGITADTFKTQVATGADDDAMAAWINANTTPHSPTDLAVWNNSLRYKRICEMPPELQLFLETYIPEVIPEEKRPHVRYWFDVYDLEENRM